jgi:hypothetical protein
MRTAASWWNFPLSILTSLYGTSLYSLSQLLFCTCLLISLLFLPRTDWPGCHCHQCLLTSATSSIVVWAAPFKTHNICCSFSDVGFPFSDGSPAYPCYLVCHPKVFAVGAPFSSTCWKDGIGLCLSPLKIWPNSICEACMLQSMMDQELTGWNVNPPGQPKETQRI